MKGLRIDGRTPDMRLESLHKNIGRNFKDDIWHKEDGKGYIWLHPFEMKVLGELQRESIGNIDS